MMATMERFIEPSSAHEAGLKSQWTIGCLALPKG